MKIKNLKYIFYSVILWLFFLNLWALAQWEWWLINCPSSDLQSSWWCEVYSPGDNRYCSNWIEGETTEPWLTLYLDNLSPDVREEYNIKIQQQNLRFWKLMLMYNQGHPDDVIVWWWWFAWLQQVWSLNRLMDVYWLDHNPWCRLWNITLNTYFTAELCSKIYTDQEVQETSTTDCPDGWEFNQDYCCTKSVSCDNPATPQTETWTCWSWSQNNWLWCCISICSWNTIMPEWWTSASDCTWCIEGETVPNADHTKCVCDSSVKCCWIKLNTVVPFIWDCIELDSDSSRSDTTSVNSVTAFPILMQWLMKIVMSVIMVFSFIMLIVAWLMMTAWSISNNSFTKWKTILKNVIISLILLWCSWLILSLINPSFFGG